MAKISLSAEHPGVARTSNAAPGALEAATRLLQRNHDEHHMFWRSVAGHNHISHSVLTILALGGGPAELQRAFDDGADIQRPMPAADSDIIARLNDPQEFWIRMGQLDQYANFLVYFARQIEARGYRAVVLEYCFDRTSKIAEAMFAQLFEGLYHPVIHLAFGVEFDQPAIVAEALAQAASHDSMGVEPFLLRCEQLALKARAEAAPLVQLFHEAGASPTLRSAPRGFENGPDRVRDGIFGRAGDEVAALAAQFRVSPHELQRRLAEMVNCAAYVAASAQRAGRPRKIDFFHLHTVTAALSLSVLGRQSWITDAGKARLVEWKARMDLVWYCASGGVELRLEDVLDYTPALSAGMDWSALYGAVTTVHDDGHLAKFVRALKHGEEVSRPFEDADAFPIKGRLWLKIAQMAYDTSVDRPIERKWIWGVGFDENWADVMASEV
ncbi:hypothetical protein BDV10DRAFT_202676 [Aspergillus recurvatus]